MKMGFAITLVFLFSFVASADRQVNANSALGFGTTTDKNKEATADRESANKIVGKDAQALSDTAATPAHPEDQVVSGHPGTVTDEAFKTRVKTDLVVLSTRIGKLRNRVLADAEFKKYDARAEVARLDERWQKLEEIASQWSATRGAALKLEQKKDIDQRLVNLKTEVAKQEVEFKK